MPVAGFEKNVFINCPFDDDYRQLLLSLVFTVLYLGYQPRLSLERADSAENRIDKIIGLINESKFGIHDLSRIVSTEENQHFRMNMPFELGIDFGCKKLKGRAWNRKQILVLEKERYRYQQALSDLSGSDIKNHNDDPGQIIAVVRDWFVTTELNRAISGNKIWHEYNDFQAHLYDELVENDGHESVDDVQASEIIMLMESWIQERKS
tara:strand:+ start:2817 stop:3440 length:624 start_codon:yes stop_codon:yes gene_type:complete